MMKLKNRKGFTLAELLIVVAIVGVLVAISIPVFTSKLEKARESTDVANLRAAKAAAVAKYLDEDKSAAGNWLYDAEKGTLVATGTSVNVKGYGKGTSVKGGIEAYDTYTEDTVASGKVIAVTIAEDGTLTIAFSTT